MPALHAKLSPSGAKLDLKCAANRREQAKHPRSRSEASDKGTGAHKLGEHCLTDVQDTNMYLGWWCGCNAKGADFLMQAHPGSGEVSKGVAAFQVDAKMAQDVQLYVDTVRQICAELTGSTLGVEIKSKLNENRGGTSDAVVAQMFGTLHIVDYKNGVSYVEADWNPQMMIYALGQLVEYGVNGVQFTAVKMTIVQPNAREGAPVRTCTMTPEQLLEWYNNVLVPADEQCLRPDAPYNPGPWCKDDWCDARHSCPALAAHINKAAQGMFSPVVAERPAAPPAPVAMTPEQRKLVLENKPLIESWLKEVYSYEYQLHQQGQGSWGKLVKGKNSRSWANQESAKMKLNALLHGDIYVEQTLKSPAQVETALKGIGHTNAAAKSAIKDLVKTTPGYPRLVAPDAKGAAITPTEAMFKPIN